MVNYLKIFYDFIIQGACFCVGWTSREVYGERDQPFEEVSGERRIHHGAPRRGWGEEVQHEHQLFLGRIWNHD
jgi:hypothetical protein